MIPFAICLCAIALLYPFFLIALIDRLHPEE